MSQGSFLFACFFFFPVTFLYHLRILVVIYMLFIQFIMSYRSLIKVHQTVHATTITGYSAAH